MNIFVAVPLSFLPRKYQEKLTRDQVPPSGALLSGILETTISLGLLVHGYFVYTDERLHALSVGVMEKAGAQGGETAIMGMGTIFLLEYLIHLTAIVLVFFMLEGIVRAVAAFGSSEALPSLPLHVVASLQDRLVAQNHEQRLGKRVRDDIKMAADGDSLQIATCRPKPWTQLTTISHEGVFYELVSENSGLAPRCFVYVLRKKHPTSVIRGIYSYHPDEVLQSTN